MSTATRSTNANTSVGQPNSYLYHQCLQSESQNEQHSTVDASNFPLRSIKDVVGFFRRSTEDGFSGKAIEPDLTLLSIVAGYVELSLTTGDAALAAEHALLNATLNTTISPPPLAGGAGSAGISASNRVIKSNSVPFPVVTYELVSGLYKKFQSILSVVEKPKSMQNRQATREVIKKVSDVIWHSLIRSSYKDRAHLQNLYCYLSGNKLDCFGVALAVVAGCQMLGYRDVHLAISEDHAWVVFGSTHDECIEVTWHGKGSEDKRGQDITAGIESGSWLYLGGLAVVCDRAMEVAAIATAINISMTTNSDCVEVADLQQQLLWVLYDMGHLKKFPMALGTLGELEEICSTPKRISCEQLYKEAIQSARRYYRNHHVYPYTYQGNFYNRLLKYREAFAAWANAADVIRIYTYSCRDDEEIYKELLDIANEMIPHVMKTESSGHSGRSILRDSEAFANLLRFYDGICQWEEDSLTPILHIGWAKPLVNNITKFDYDIRSQVVINVPIEDEITQAKKQLFPSLTETTSLKVLENIVREVQPHVEVSITETKSDQDGTYSMNNNILKTEEKALLDAKKSDITTTLADLTAACGEKILNPVFLLQGGGEPFAEQKKQLEQGQSNRNNNAENGLKIIANNENDSSVKAEKSENNTKKLQESESIVSSSLPSSPPPVDIFEFMIKRPIITLYSQKMKGLKDLLLAEKLNTHAISLQVTAQSVASKKVRGIDKLGNHTTTSTYATAHVPNNVPQPANLAEGNTHTNDNGGPSSSIAAARPKRSRRE
ncbi:PREDICTED: menin isoform X2 [Rhagoletis zephyria]|uniref:menin isoform X2 n=2 Tax=Rhagoletis TaxID=28609 RepID=UPI0008119C4B|nr:PREDICTED: menin isoform X2 [Rhagoletis zephyria]XP_017484648.1 PREDICTED: menin isoform X2 [Rhagoletis zephyria]XP_017484649.1 PREDICTED: menin isoform X2 [Rhagoletis zephyria]